MDLEENDEIPVFHFMDLKNKLEKYGQITVDEIPDEFHIDPQGFHI